MLLSRLLFQALPMLEHVGELEALEMDGQALVRTQWNGSRRDWSGWLCHSAKAGHSWIGNAGQPRLLVEQIQPAVGTGVAAPQLQTLTNFGT